MTSSQHTAKKSSLILLLMTMTLLGVFPLDVVLPSFPALSDYFRTSASDIALSVSLFAIGLALSVVLVGPLPDLWGRKNLLLAGIAISTVGAIGCVFSSEYSWFLVFRVIQAVGCGSFALSQALIQDLFIGREQERIRIWMTTAGGVFISISPLLGTWLQMHLGWEGSFYVFIGLAVIVWIKVGVLLKETPRVVMSRPVAFSVLIGDCVAIYASWVIGLFPAWPLPAIFHLSSFRQSFSWNAWHSRLTNLPGHCCCTAWPMCSAG